MSAPTRKISRAVRLASCVAAIAVSCGGTAGVAFAQDYDVVIKNGRVMDPETNFDGVRNVGIKGRSIVAITKDDISGTREIDAAGHVVAPGFIDPHVHVVDHPFAQKLMLRDGVTTPLDLEVGAWPVERFYDHMEGKSQANYGATVSALGVREGVFNPK